MICYVDSSALVKRYFTEPGSLQLRRFIADADAIVTASISRVEVVATFGKLARHGAVTQLEVTESLIDRASDYSWTYGLRGYDSVQLASASFWQERLGTDLAFATFDVRLWKAAARVGLQPFPQDLPEIH